MATIIKTHAPQQASGTAFRTVAYDLTDMAAQADDYLTRVRREAAQIVEQAQQEAATIRQNAESAGRHAAEQAIERILDEKVAKQMKTLTPALQAAVKQVTDSKQEWLRHWESAALDVALSMAARIVRSELQHRPEISLDWIRESLKLASGSGEITIRLHASDQQALERQVSQLGAVFAPLARLSVVPAESISPGGCQLTTEFGVIDNQLETQLARIRQELS